MIFTTCLISYSLSWIHGRFVSRPTVLSDIQQQAVIASLEKGMSLTQTATTFGVSVSTISWLKQQMREG